MRRFLLRLFIPVLVLSLAAPVSARRRKQPPPQGPWELKIYGPGLIRESQELEFKVVLTNRSQAAIFLPSRDAPSASGLSLTG